MATLIAEVLFKQFLIRAELKIPDREEQWILQFQTIAGARGTIIFPHSGYCDYKRTFQTVLDSYC